MAGRLEADPSELLAKALDLAVGGLALARYAATHTTDKRLQRTFLRVASTSEHQAQVLREQLAELAVGGDDGVAGRSTRERASRSARSQFVAGAIVASVAIVGAGVAFRVFTAPADDPLRRALSRMAGLVSWRDGAVPGTAARGLAGDRQGVASPASPPKRS